MTNANIQFFGSGLSADGEPSPAQIPLNVANMTGAAAVGALSKYTANPATSAATATVASISGAPFCVLDMTGTLGAGAALTLPTVAILVAGMTAPAIGQSWRIRIINSSSANFAWTVTTAAGWTLNGTMTIAQNTTRDFIVTLTSLTAATLQQIGTGTTS